MTSNRPHSTICVKGMNFPYVNDINLTFEDLIIPASCFTVVHNFSISTGRELIPSDIHSLIACLSS